MENVNFGLPPPYFAAAFPFHLVLDGDLVIVQAGEVMQRICPQALGHRLDEVFSIVRPRIPISYSAICAEQHSLFFLHSLQGQHQFKGQMLYVAETGNLIFLGSPWLTALAQVGNYGLTLNDFASHDSMVHYLTLLQTKDSALREANTLAEKLSRQRAELRNLNDELALQHAVTQVLAEVMTLDEAAVKILNAICDKQGWDFGAIWLLDEDARLLRCIESYQRSGFEASDLADLSRARVFEKGAGLAGSVWQLGSPQSIEDIAHDKKASELDVEGMAIALREGLHGACAFPLLLGNEVLGVIELYSCKPRQVSVEWIQLMAGIGSQIGQFIERKNAESAFRESEERYRVVAETATDAMITINSNSRILFANRAAETIFGHQLQNLIGQPLTQLMPEYLRHLHEQGLAKHIDTGKKHIPWNGVVLPGLHKDGREIPLEVSFSSYQKDGHHLFTGIIRDITQRKLAEDQLRDAGSRMEALIANLQEGVLVETEDRSLILTNQEFCRLFSIPVAPQDMIGANCAEAAEGVKELFVSPNGFIDRIQEIIKTRMVVTDEELQLRDGRTLERDYVPIFVEKDYRGHLWVYRDITERKRFAAELQQARDEAEAASRSKGEFLANMSHEIRTPLNTIIGMTELALESELESERLEFLKVTQSSSELLLHLINDILDFSKIEAGQMDIDSIPFDLPEVIEGIAKLMSARAGGKGLELNCRIDPQLPARVLGDPNRLRQILLNLVSNAIKFTEKGSVAIEANSIKSSEEEEMEVHFAVSDTGIGIAEENQGRIFEKFCQADFSNTRRYDGTGLGLSISKSLTELMRGRIWFESALGKGSTFHFSIPFPVVERAVSVTSHPGPSQTDKAQFVAKAKSQAGRTQAGELKRVLLVEDNQANQQLAVRILRSDGYLVDIAENGKYAVEMAQSKRYDLILMDIQMPVMDGFTATAEIRRRERESELDAVPIVALTARAIEGYRERCLESGMDEYMTKPVKRERLLQVVGDMLDRRHVVLIVDDTVENQKLVRNYLKNEKLRLLFAHNGRKALEILEKRAVSLVLLDMEMPMLNGYETVRELRMRPDGQTVPVIALTAHEGPEQRARCLASGCPGFLSKPFRKTQLIEMISKYLEKNSDSHTPSQTEKSLTQAVAERPMDDDIDLIAWVDEDIMYLIPDFLNERRRDVERIKELLDAGDFSAIKTLGHNMKGNGAGYGFNEITQIGSGIEESARQNDRNAIAGFNEKLEAYLSAVQIRTRKV